MATNVKRPSGRSQVQDAVLDAAERLWAAHGPTDVSLRAIAADAGVNYGLVHRHFGTKEALIERLMERYAERWTSVLESGPDYETALDRLFGAGPDAGPFIRLLAWTLLGERDSASSRAPERTSLLDQLPTLRADTDTARATADTAAALAFIFGWRFFNPFIRAVLHLDDDDPRVHAQMRHYLSLLTRPTASPSAGTG